MNFLKTAGTVLFLAVFVAAGMYGLTTKLDPHTHPRARFLLVASLSGEWSERTVEGARAAAERLGIELDVITPRSTSSIDQQTALSERLCHTRYDGVALSPADANSELRLINDLVCHAKLVTLDRDCDGSNRLCHFGYSQFNAGALAARLAESHMSPPGKVAVLSTTHSDATADQPVGERLAGFADSWKSDEYRAMHGPIVEVTLDATGRSTNSNALAATLADPNVAVIIALDVESAECALTALATLSVAHRVPIITFDPNEAIFDAIQDGRVTYAVFDDPYQSGFAAVEKLGVYSSGDRYVLPTPGRGTYILANEVVSAQNLTEVRRRLHS
jgi:ribose transport system substrate-binding protein